MFYFIEWMKKGDYNFKDFVDFIKGYQSLKDQDQFEARSQKFYLKSLAETLNITIEQGSYSTVY